MTLSRNLRFECYEERMNLSALSFVHQSAEIVPTVAVADFDGDLRPDLVGIEPRGSSNAPWFWSQNINDRRDLLRQPGTHPLEAHPARVRTEDVDGDGDYDLALIEGELQWFEKSGCTGSLRRFKKNHK